MLEEEGQEEGENGSSHNRKLLDSAISKVVTTLLFNLC